MLSLEAPEEGWAAGSCMVPALWPWLGCRAEVVQDNLFQFSLSVTGGKGPSVFTGSSVLRREGI